MLTQRQARVRVFLVLAIFLEEQNTLDASGRNVSGVA
jgi:hypothetical protein